MKKLLFLCLTVLFSLGVMGSGHAGWMDTVQIFGNVETGFLAVGLRCLGVVDWSPGLANPEAAGLGSSTWANGHRSCDIEGHNYYESIELQISNCCPSYVPGFILEIGNGGTIPARIEGLNLDRGDNASLRLSNWNARYPDGFHCCGKDLNSMQRALRGTILEPGENLELELKFSRKQAEKQTESGLATCIIEVDYCRWNESL